MVPNISVAVARLRTDAPDVSSLADATTDLANRPELRQLQQLLVLLVLAIERIGAVVNPVAPIFGSNEVAVMSDLAQPSMVITVGNSRGFDLANMHMVL